MKTWLYHVNDFILLLLLSLLTERDELIAVVIFLATGYIGVFLVHKLMKKNNRICHTVNNSNNRFFYFSPFLSIWHHYVTAFLLYRTCSWTRISSSKSLGGIVWFGVSAIFYTPFPPLWKLLLLVLHIMITFWLTGANRNQQLLRFASIITIGVMSIVLIQVFPFIRLVFHLS